MKEKHLTGLTDAQVLESRKKHGANILTPPEKDPLWKQFLEKFGRPANHYPNDCRGFIHRDFIL